MAVILRRRKLGRTSCREIANLATSQINIVRNWKPRDWAGNGGVCDPLIMFRWGCTSSVQGLGITLTVNTAESISWCSNKKNGRLEMQDAGVPVPKTWGDPSQFECDEPWPVVGTNGKQYVVRPSTHAQGRNLFVGCGQDAVTAWHNFSGGYISELIDKVAEFRVFVCQNRVVWVAKKTPADPYSVAWNVAQGGRFDNVRWSDWNTKVIDAALKASKVSGTDFCGVDVMVDREGNPYVLEVNSAPSQTSPYRQSCVAKAFDYIIQNNSKAHFEDVEWHERRTWKSYIHPAVRGDDE